MPTNDKSPLIAVLKRIADALEQQGSADDLLSVAEVAGLLRIDADKVRGHIRAGKLRGHNLNAGGSRPHIVVRRSSVYEFLDGLTVEPPTTKRRAKKSLDPGDWA
jgi:hypothetical protein